jgi:inhibitor of cysteine peptidase
MRSHVVAGKVSAVLLAASAVCAGLAGCGSATASARTDASVSPGTSTSATAAPSATAAASQATAPSGSARTVTIGAADDGRHVRLARGEVLAVQLPSNPSTGYSWEVFKVTGQALRQDGKAAYEPTPEATPMPGSGGTETFRFAAVAKGASRIVFDYRRPWEKGVKPVRMFTVSAQVRGHS